MIKNRGFTLVELIIVVTLTTLLGLILTDVLIQTLRGETKVRVVSEVKQNGQTVLERLVNLIRQGDNILCVGDGYADKDTLIVFKTGEYYRFRYISPDTEGDSQRNGQILYDKFTGDDFADISEARCEDQNLIASKSLNLTDTDLVQGVSLNFASEPGFTDSIFSKDYLAGYKDAVTVKFKVTAGVKAGSTYEASVADGGILFNTTVGLRNTR